MDERVEHYRELLRRAYGGRRWVVAMDVLAAMTALVDELKELGADAAFCVAGTRGVGDAPDEAFAPNPVVLETGGHDMMSSVRAALAALANLPPEAVQAIDAFDPEKTGMALGTIFDDGRPVGGRQKYGARPAAWQALEDKTTIDEVWDALGVARSPSIVVNADDRDALRAASESLNVGDHTVWAADSREGFHGGASFTRWVRTEEDFDSTQRLFAAHADRIRVMPFLEGIPCSIHGIVFPDDVVVLRPCEMLVFRREGTGTFHYGKAATFWDPPAADREEMREVARRVGRHLHETFGYRGAFTVDGIMAKDGFRPTELNPRYGAALGILARPVDLPLYLLNLALVEGEPFDWRPRDLEDLLLTAADEVRSGGTMAMTSVETAHSDKIELVYDNGEFRARDIGDGVDATLVVGPGASGTAVLVNFDSKRTPVGESVAPRAAAVLRWADAEYGLGLGVLTPARDVRR